MTTTPCWTNFSQQCDYQNKMVNKTLGKNVRMLSSVSEKTFALSAFNKAIQIFINFLKRSMKCTASTNNVSITTE